MELQVHALPRGPSIEVVTGNASLRSGHEPPSTRVTSARAPGTEPVPVTAGGFEALASVLGSDDFEGAMGPVARLYLAYFGRLPDFEGFQYYIDERDAGQRLAAIAEEFAGSREFKLRYGSLDHAGFVDRIAQNVFDGQLDPIQRAYWLEGLQSGALTRGQVMLAFSEGTLFRSATDNEVFVAIAYAEALQRAPEPADSARWVSFLEGGNPRTALVEALVREREKR